MRPILPSPRELKTDEILSDDNGDPYIPQRRYLLSCNISNNEVKNNHPGLWAYLKHGVKEEINKRYLCRHREPWFCQEQRPVAPFLCTYMGRRTAKGRAPFRFILNNSQATATNVYLMLYPKPSLSTILKDNQELRRRVWKALSAIASDILTKNGRVYGEGLYKLEPKELANVPADVLCDILPKKLHPPRRTQMELFVH